jgi:hypothetical protein
MVIASSFDRQIPMKTARIGSFCGKLLIFSLTLPSFRAVDAAAAVSPLPVSAGGVSIFFDQRAANSNGWSTLSLPSASADIISIEDLDVAVQKVGAQSITSELGTTLAIEPAPLVNALAQWNSRGMYLQTRPAGNAATLLLLTLRNSWGSDLSSLVISYDFGALVASDSTINETVPGQRLYYSLTGSSNSWVNITQITNPGPVVFCLSFPDAWQVGANLYLLWADDNGPSSDSVPLREGAYTIDNLQISQSLVLPTVIDTQPHDLVVEEGRSTNLTVHCSGLSVQYQWFKNGAAISGATNSVLSITNAHLEDSGTYFVQVHSDIPFSSCSAPSSAESRHVTVTVNADVTQPVVVRALGQLNETSIVITFSEPMEETSIGEWAFQLIWAGELIYVLQTRMISDSQVELIVDAALGLLNYDLSIDPSVSDPHGNPLAHTTVPLAIEVPLLSFQDTLWKYNHEGVDLGTAWRGKAYDDSSWSNGITVLNNPSLPLHFGNYSVDDLPVYYFRTHFQVPTMPEGISELRLRTLVDDFDAAWLNGHDVPVHVHSAYTNAGVDVYGYGEGTAVGTPTILPNNGYYQIDPTNLVFGDNLIAAKLFQVNPASLDISFAYELTAIIDRFAIPDTHLQIARDPANPQQWLLQWNASTGRLYESGEITASATGWTPVSEAAAGAYVIPAGVAVKFYSIRP